MRFGLFFHGLIAPREDLCVYRMPESIANSHDGHIVYYEHTVRMSTPSLLGYAFYFQGNLAAVDTMIALMGTYCGVADRVLL